MSITQHGVKEATEKRLYILCIYLHEFLGNAKLQSQKTDQHLPAAWGGSGRMTVEGTWEHLGGGNIF